MLGTVDSLTLEACCTVRRARMCSRLPPPYVMTKPNGTWRFGVAPTQLLAPESKPRVAVHTRLLLFACHHADTHNGSSCFASNAPGLSVAQHIVPSRSSRV